ncbi:mechanosensitive ion channel family protein [Candidatus Woesearchaeota archaeon]|nr:mechanosensitive ion channel family protein [Candidatus Woesearchaeota archaeon]
MVDWQALLSASWQGNTVQEYAVAVGVFLAAWFVLRFFKYVVIQRLKALAKKTKTDVDDAIIEAKDSIGWPFYAILAVFIGLKFIDVHPALDKGMYYLLIVTITYYVARIAHRMIGFFADKWDEKKGRKGTRQSPIVNLLKGFVQGLLWVLVILLILDNLGYNVSALLAGVGIGGIAIAFALQGILSDLFASVSIYFDKPFEVGDFLIIGGDMGTVKKIGIKSTRLQTLQGQELVVSNQELTSTRINNYKKLEKRRVAFKFGVTYDTPATKLKRIPGMVEKIVKDKGLAEFDRAHFKEFADSSLLFEVVYYLNSSDYKEYMDTQESINLDIVKAFNKAKVEMAFPTTTVYLKK